ncbi:MAG: amidohydrolase, partial [Burkholderiales bacterium]|nr:amidohydrolase [Burkholderiales bacterium]
MTEHPALSAIKQWHDEYIAFRRDLHAHPEIGFDLPRTAQKISDHLSQLGIEYYTGMAKSGVIAVIPGRISPNRRHIGLRADMDALLIRESNRFAHASCTPGRMHGCGHDGHTTMLLACARYLAQTRNFVGTAYCIFQPAEEGADGCKQMIEEGLLNRFPLDFVYALHNWPELPFGKVAVRTGAVMASCDKLTIEIEGVGGHGAMPYLTV